MQKIDYGPRNFLSLLLIMIQDRSVDRADEEDLYPESKIKEAATPGNSALFPILQVVHGNQLLQLDVGQGHCTC